MCFDLLYELFCYYPQNLAPGTLLQSFLMGRTPLQVGIPRSSLASRATVRIS